ncbi:MAG: DNA-deoxyinosine glycosylase [Gammaproteobacteria bacterium]|nr:DNA-deoxyinosine glycosylase [Gammaproteobacteria bacterium]
MAQVQSFEPIIGHQPRVLILGSMPGTASLQAVEYYAHPRNAFWPIMAALFGIDAEASYPIRVQQLSRHPLIVWDILQACYRPGSLDSNIDVATAEANDFQDLLQQFPHIRAILFNGATSEKYFYRLVIPSLSVSPNLELLRMPSTSPANAGMNFKQKRDAWRRILDFID